MVSGDVLLVMYYWL